jgi:hypothetical protein
MIKLDWLGMKYYQKHIIIVPLVVILYGFFSAAIIIPLTAFMMLSFSVNPFAVEEKGKLDNLYLTLPVTRRTIVNARFGLSLIMQLVGLEIGTVMTIIYSNLFYGKTIFYTHTFKADLKTMLLIIGGSLLLYSVMNLSIFPILFKIGYAKGKGLGFYMPIIVIAIAAAVLFILWHLNNTFREFTLSVIKWAFINTLWTAIIMAAAAALILIISYMLSYKMYAKREF